MLWSSQDISQGGLFITLYSIVNPGVRDFILLVPTPSTLFPVYLPYINPTCSHTSHIRAV